MEIIVEKAGQAAWVDGRTCNCGSNSSGNQGSMCRAGERPHLEVAEGPVPSLGE